MPWQSPPADATAAHTAQGSMLPRKKRKSALPLDSSNAQNK